MPALLSKRYLDLLAPEEWEALAFIHRQPHGLSWNLYSVVVAADALAKCEDHGLLAVRDGRLMTTPAGQIAVACWLESEEG